MHLILFALLLLLGADRGWAVESYPPQVSGGEMFPDFMALIGNSRRTVPIYSIAVHPEGRVLASGSNDGTVRLWSVESGEELRRLEGHTSWVRSVSFSADGLLLASGSDDGTVRLWSGSDGRELRRFQGHSSWVRSVSFSADGQMLVSGSNDGTVRLWSVDSGQELRRLEGHSSGVLSVSFSSDGKLLASGSSDGTVRLWSVDSGEELRRLEGNTSWVLSVSFSSDGRVLASGSDDGTVRLWSVDSGEELRRLEGHSSGVRSVSFSVDGRTLASGSDDGTVRLWSVDSGEELRRLEGHTSWVRSVSFSRDGRLLVSGSTDGTVRLWSVSSGQELRRLEGHTSWVLSVSFSKDGQVLASGSSDGLVRLWSADSGEELRRLEGHTSWVRSVSFSGDGQALASGSDDGTVRLWSVGSGEELRRLEGHTSGVRSVSFSGDGQTLASGSNDGTVRLWSVDSGEELRLLEGHTKGVRSVSFSSDGQTLASGSDDETVRLWSVSSGRELRRLEGHRSWVRSVSFSGSGQLLASGSDDETVRLWSVGSGQELHRLEGHQSWVRSVSFSDDGRSLASGSNDGTVRLWSLRHGEEFSRLEGHTSGVRSVSFSGDGQTLASASDDGTVRLWSVNSDQELRRLEDHRSLVRTVSFSGDGQLLASGASDGTVRLWSVATGKELRRLEGHRSWVRSVSFSGNGQMLASGLDDGTVRLWSVATGKEIRHLEGHSQRVRTVSFSGDGQLLASGSDDGTVRLWSVSSGKELRRLEGHTSAVLSVSFGGDGQLLASGSSDGTVRLWSVSSGQELDRLEGHGSWVRSVSFSRDGQLLASGSDDETVRLWSVGSGQELDRLEGHTSWVRTVSFRGDGQLLASGSDDGTVRLWGLNIPALSRVMVGGRDGSWLSCRHDGNCLRFQARGLLRREGEAGSWEPIPPATASDEVDLVVEVEPAVIAAAAEAVTSFALRISNRNNHPVFGLRVWHPAGSETSLLLHEFDEPLQIAAGESLSLGGELEYVPERINPRDQDLTLDLTLAAVHGKPMQVEIPVKGLAPMPEVTAAAVAATAENLELSVENLGSQPLGAATYQPRIPELADDAFDILTRSQLLPGVTATLPFAPPEGASLGRDTLLNMVIRRTEFPFYEWQQPNISVRISTPWLLYIVATLLFIVATTLYVYQRLFRHPLVLMLGKHPNRIRTVPLNELTRARRLLTRTRRLGNILATAHLSRRSLDRAIAFCDADPRTQAARLAEHLEAHGEVIPDAPLPAYTLTFPGHFLLNLERCLLIFPPPHRDPEEIIGDIKRLPGGNVEICLVLSINPDQQTALGRLAPDPVRMWVVPDSGDLTRLLLDPKPLTVLARLIASQVKVSRISPYQGQGGVKRSGMFFGRDRIRNGIVARDPTNYLIFGARQLGKSSLLLALERHYRDDPRVDCRYVSLSDTGIDGALARVLGESGVYDRERLLARLGEPGEAEYRVLLLDEADEFVLAEAESGYATLRRFRDLMAEGRCYFILAGFWKLYQKVSLDYHSPIRNFGELIQLGALEISACRDLITLPMDAVNLHYESDALVERIITETGQRANLIALTCGAILKHLDITDRQIQAKVVDKALDDDSLRTSLAGWGQLVQEDEQGCRLDRIVVYATVEQNEFAWGDITRVLEDNDCLYQPEKLRESLQRLTLAFVIERKRDRYRYRVPLFRAMILEEEPERSLAQEIAAYKRHGAA